MKFTGLKTNSGMLLQYPVSFPEKSIFIGCSSFMFQHSIKPGLQKNSIEGFNFISAEKSSNFYEKFLKLTLLQSCLWNKQQSTQKIKNRKPANETN